MHKSFVTRAPDEANAPGAGAALAALFLTYVFNYLDSTLIYILFPLIKSEMAMTETQLALLGSTSFVLFYTVLGVPFGRLADRVARTKMIACGLTVWSVASAATGLMHGFGGLFACRVTVGIAFLAAAYYSSAYGPELPLEAAWGGYTPLIQGVMAVTGICIIFGFMARWAALVGLACPARFKATVIGSAPVSCMPRVVAGRRPHRAAVARPRVFRRGSDFTRTPRAAGCRPGRWP